MLKHNRFFGFQFFQQLGQLRNTGGQFLFPRNIPERQLLLLGKEGFALSALFLDLLHKRAILLHFRFHIRNIGFELSLSGANMPKLITENQHVLTHTFHRFGYGRDGILYCLHQLFNGSFQFTEHCVISLDLPVQLTAVRDNAFLLQCPCNNALVNGRLFC